MERNPQTSPTNPLAGNVQPVSSKQTRWQRADDLIEAIRADVEKVRREKISETMEGNENASENRSDKKLSDLSDDEHADKTATKVAEFDKITVSMSKHFEPLSQNSKTQHPIDWNSPDQQAMADEEQNEEFIDAGSIKNIPVSALKDLIRFVLPQGKSESVRWRSGMMRLAVISHLADVDEDGGKTLSQIADELKVSRAALSWHHVRILDQLGLGESRSSKSREARAKYSVSCRESHRRQGHQIKSTPPMPAPNA
jgi:hypothetical protein